MLLFQFVAYSQTYSDAILKSGYVDYGNFGYFPVNEYDTIPAVILVSDTSRHGQIKTFAIRGYCVRQKYKYHGDPMPPLNYDDYFKIIGYLNDRKTKLSSTYIVWESKL